MCHAGEWKDILIRITGSFTWETGNWTKMICRTTLVIISPLWRVPWGAWFQSLKARPPQGNLDMNLFKIKLRRYMRKQNQLWNQVAQHSFVSKWAWIKSYLPSQTSLGYDFAYALTLVSDWLWGWWLLVPKGLCGPKFTPLPNKEHPINAQHKPCNQSGVSFDPSCTS